MGLIALLLFCVVCMVGFFVGDWHLGVLGHFYGNAMIGIEALAALVALGAWRLRRSQKFRQSNLVCFYGLGALLAALSWFVHPNQVIDRAALQLNDWESAITDYQFHRELGEQDALEKERVPAMASELHARQLVYTAALERATGAARFYNGAEYSYILLGLAAVSVVLGAMYQRGTWPFPRLRELRSSTAPGRGPPWRRQK